MQKVDDAELVDQGHSALGKIFRASERKIDRELKDQIGAVVERHLTALVLVHDGRDAALHEVPAHDNDDAIRVTSLAYGVQLV